MSKKTKNVGIIGLGTVGSGVYETLINKREKIEGLIDGSFHIPIVLVKDVNKTREVAIDTQITDTLEDFLKVDLDAVVEASPDSDIAYPYVRQLLGKGITVVTANKELVAKYGEELLELAEVNQCRLYFEAAVAGGIPLLTSLRHTLKTNDVEKMEGIVNGTSNFILTKMREEGTPFQQALEEAQEKGYAEAVPDKDIDGWDAYYKTVILSHWLYGEAPTWTASKPKGVREIDTRDLVLADEFNGRIKHIASLEKLPTKVVASVRPRFVLNTHPLYGVEGVNNGIHVKGSIVGSLLFQGAGAGKFPTASAVIEDLINDWTGTSEKSPFVYQDKESKQSLDSDESVSLKQMDENASLWLVSGKQLAYSFEKQNNIESVTEIKKSQDRESVMVYGTESEVIKVLNAVNDGISIYPVLGDVEDVLDIHRANKRLVSEVSL